MYLGKQAQSELVGDLVKMRRASEWELRKNTCEINKLAKRQRMLKEKVSLVWKMIKLLKGTDK